MHESALILSVVFVAVLLLVSTFIKDLTRSSIVPYTVAVLGIGFVAQLLVRGLGWEVAVNASPEFIFYVLLPLLLFESASQINSHQFKLQFRTITFLATFGLLVAIGVVGLGLSWFLGLPLGVGLLFGAIISATDPIAVLAIFKSLGSPKRLAMLAEGESMFNDATAVIAFRVIAAVVVAGQVFSMDTLWSSMATFGYVFLGSLVVGGIMGWLTSTFIEKVENDRIIETTLTISLALLSFIIPEHFFHLSGVISTVAAGVVFGNLSQTRVSGAVVSFMHEFWEYLGFLSVTAVFFFAAFSLEFAQLWQQPFELAVVIGVVLLSRAISIYVSAWIMNHWSFFDREPNIPLSWQNILNWGGLRGVIPLVLVYSLPETFAFRELLISYTLVVFVYSLLVHGMSIRRYLQLHKLDRPHSEMKVAQKMMELLRLDEKITHLETLPKTEFDPELLKQEKRKLSQQLERTIQKLKTMAGSKAFEHSLRLQVIAIERTTLHALFQLGHISESAVLEFEGELDLQQDAVQYREVAEGRGFSSGGLVKSKTSFRKQLNRWRRWLLQLGVMKNWLNNYHIRLVQQRVQLLRARLISSDEVLRYLRYLEQYLLTDGSRNDVLQSLKERHQGFNRENQSELQEYERSFPKVYAEYQSKVLKNMLNSE